MPKYLGIGYNFIKELGVRQNGSICLCKLFLMFKAIKQFLISSWQREEILSAAIIYRQLKTTRSAQFCMNTTKPPPTEYAA